MCVEPGVQAVALTVQVFGPPSRSFVVARRARIADLHESSARSFSAFTGKVNSPLGGKGASFVAGLESPPSENSTL